MVNLFGYDFSVSELVAMSLSLFLTLFYALKTGGIKKLIKEVNEYMIKFRSQQTVEPTVGQSIDNKKPEYRLNKATDTLEETGEIIDMQAIIDSCADLVLSKVLDRFLPAIDEKNDLIADYSMLKDDLDDLAQVMSKAEEYRAYFGLDDKLSVQEIYDYVSKQAQGVKKSIDEYNDKLKRGIKNEESKVDEESK